MRKFIVLLIVLVLVVVGVLVLAIMNMNAILEENRERLSAMASEAIGREVRFDRAEVTFSKGLAIRIDGLRIAEDPDFGKGDFVTLDSAFVDVEVGPALQRRLAVGGVRLEGPTIRVIRTLDGFNFSSLGSADSAGRPEEEASSGSDSTGDGDGGSGSEGTDLALAIAAFEIRDGTILYQDRTANPPLSLVIENFESSGTDLSLEGPIEIAFSGRVRPVDGDDSLTSPVRGRIRIRDLATGAGELRLASPTFHPGLLGLVFEEGKGADERMEDLDLDIGLPADPAAVGYPISLRASGGRLAGVGFTSLDARLRYRGSTVGIKRLVIGLAGGSVEVVGSVTFGPPGRAPFRLETRLEGLDASEVGTILLDLPKGALSGRIAGEIDLAGDSLDWETLKKSLAGRIRIEVGRGAIENVNLLDRLVGRLVVDPGLGQLTAASIRDVAPTILKQDRTAFEKVDLDLAIENGGLLARSLELDAGDFSLRALGTRIGLDGSVSGAAKIRFSEPLSRKILARADRLAPLLGGEGVVELPLRLEGSVSSIELRPDLTALASDARANATAELTNEAARRLSKALFGKQGASKQGEPASPRDPERTAADELLEKGLDRLFGN